MRRVWPTLITLGLLACAKAHGGFGEEQPDASDALDPDAAQDEEGDATTGGGKTDAAKGADASKPPVDGSVVVTPGVDASKPDASSTPALCLAYSFGPASPTTSTTCYCASPNQVSDICSVCKGLTACGCSGNAAARPDVAGCVTVSGDAGVATGHCCPAQCVRSSQLDATCAATELGYYCMDVTPPAGCRVHPVYGGTFYKCCPKP